MKYILLHGLGQSSESWSEVIKELNPEWDILCPDMVEWMVGKEPCYDTLYRELESFCRQFEEPLCLCGLSLGAILAMDFAAGHAERVQSLVLIGAQYKMPRKLLKLQDIIFRFMPERAFGKMGFQKTDFISLCRSMVELDIENRLRQITARTLVICGEKDFANKAASAKLAGSLPRAELVLMQDSGHEVNRDAPVILGKEIKRFWERLQS